MMERYRLFLTRLVFAVFALALTGGPAARITMSSSPSSSFVAAQQYEKPWQSCSTFFSPNMEGWAVYAARSFKEDELVELTPFFVPLDPFLTRLSVLDNIVFGFQRGNDAEVDPIDLNVVLLGNGGFYNHHPNPNLRYVQVIAREGDDVPHLVGFRATRDIVAGEQLYVSYVDDPDKTLEWFKERGIDTQKRTAESIEPSVLHLYMAKYCSKIYGGIGAPTWKDNILPILSSNHQERGGAGIILDPSSWMDLTRLAPFDAGLSDARAKVNIKKGTMIESSLGLVMSRNFIRGTALGPIAFYWENLKYDHKQHLINLHDEGEIILQYQGPDTDWQSVDRFKGYTEMSVLPVSGSIGLVRRVGVGREESNCKLLIRPHKESLSKVGITLELIATHDIAAGDVLKLNILPSEFEEEYRLLHDEMEESGQPHHPGIFDSITEEEL